MNRLQIQFYTCYEEGLVFEGGGGEEMFLCWINLLIFHADATWNHAYLFSIYCLQRLWLPR